MEKPEVCWMIQKRWRLGYSEEWEKSEAAEVAADGGGAEEEQIPGEEDACVTSSGVPASSQFYSLSSWQPPTQIVESKHVYGYCWCFSQK